MRNPFSGGRNKPAPFSQLEAAEMRRSKYRRRIHNGTSDSMQGRMDVMDERDYLRQQRMERSLMKEKINQKG